MRYRHNWDTEGKRNRLYGRRWRKEREAFLKAQPFCTMCGAKGDIVLATVVDHKVPHKGDEALFWDHGNWQALCEYHHNSDKARIEIRGYSQALGEDGWPLDPDHPANTGHEPVSGKSRPEELKQISVDVLLVCGAPGSGKTTWARNAMIAGDTLIDFDEIDGELNGKARRPGRLIVPILRERNTRLLNAASLHSGRVFLTMTAARAEERRWWRQKLGNVSVVMMDTTLDECLRRMSADQERARTLDEQIEAARHWFSRVERVEIDLFATLPHESRKENDFLF